MRDHRRRKATAEAPLKALIIDSWFDNYLGVVSLVRVMDGRLKTPGTRSRLMAAGTRPLCRADRRFTPKKRRWRSSAPAEVGFVIAGIKEVRSARVGDTLTHAHRPATRRCLGFKEIKPRVFAGLYPVEAHDYEALRDALAKLQLNDACFTYEPETSQALGFGFRCGFLGMLHMDIIQERLEREHDLDLITTAPTVVYEVLHEPER